MVSVKRDKDLQDLVKKYGRDFVNYLEFTFLAFPSSKYAMADPEYLKRHEKILESFDKEMEEKGYTRELLSEYLDKLRTLEEEEKKKLTQMKKGTLLKNLKELV